MTTPPAASSRILASFGSLAPPRWACLGLLCLANLLVYGRLVGAAFVSYDDPLHFVANPYLRPPTLAKFVTYVSQPYAGLFTPVTHVWFTVEALLAYRPDGALDPRVIHAGSVLLEGALACLAFLLLAQLRFSTSACLLGALAFSLHPLRVETVAWATETRGLLAATLAAAAAWQFLAAQARADDTGAAQPGHTPSAATASGRKGFAGVLFALALLAKPSVVTVPLAIVLVEATYFRRPWRGWALWMAAWLAMSAAMTRVSQAVQLEDQRVAVGSLAARALVAGDSFAWHAWKAIVPWGLAIDYGRTPARVLHSMSIEPCWLFAGGWLLLATILPARRALWTATLVFVALLLPTSGLIPFGYQQFSTVADRFACLALLAPAALVAAGVDRWGRPAAIAAALGAVMLGVLSFRQTAHWLDDRSLYERALAINPASYLGHMGLANLRLDARDEEAAAEHYRAALVARPDAPQPHVGLARAIKARDLERAVAELQTALQLEPAYDKARLDLARLYLDLHRPSEVVELLAQAVAARPAEHRLAILLGRALADLERWDEARAAYQRAAEAEAPPIQATLRLGELAARRGDWRQAAEHFRAVTALDPRQIDGWWNLAAASQRLDDPATEREAYEQLLALPGLAPDAAAAARTRFEQLKSHR